MIALLLVATLPNASGCWRGMSGTAHFAQLAMNAPMPGHAERVFAQPVLTLTRAARTTEQLASTASVNDYCAPCSSGYRYTAQRC